MFYGFKDNSYDPDDEDTNFIPRLAEKALLPKLTGYPILFCHKVNTFSPYHKGNPVQLNLCIN